MQKNIKHIAKAPIGIFDSGLGGLSICKEIMKLLPNESIIYLADSLNAPYGEKTKDEIIQLSIKNTELLLSLNCKAIVVACNTATTNSIATLRKQFDVPFIGIEPAIKPAALQTKTRKIGVLATEGTLKSELFLSTSEQFRDRIELIEVKGENLVRFIEIGDIKKTKPLLKKYLSPMVEAGVDSIVLGCTHYPFLIPLIKEIIPENILIIDSGEAVAKQTEVILRAENLLNKEVTQKKNVFYTNNDVHVFKSFLKYINIRDDNALYKKF
ncbi:MAG: glutamate racemase [Vicingaceae bacterium]|nr:glutamate racemase [Vicingaceae bacterium]